MTDSITVQRLWVSVLLQVARDLTRVTQNNSGATAQAELWIGTYPTSDFRQVCTLAGLEPTKSHNWFRHICDTPFNDRRGLVHGLNISVNHPVRIPGHRPTYSDRTGEGICHV